MAENKRYFLVQEEMLPESILKTVRAKEMLVKGEATTVNEAVKKVRLSRSAFYKYRNFVFPFKAGTGTKEVTLKLSLEHRAGILSKVLTTIAAWHGNIITINQDQPDRRHAVVRIVLDINYLSGNMDIMVEDIRKIEGVKALSLQEG